MLFGDCTVVCTVVCVVPAAPPPWLFVVSNGELGRTPLYVAFFSRGLGETTVVLLNVCLDLVLTIMGCLFVVI